MNSQIVIGGYGGQGVLFFGRLLAEAGLLEGREVTWMLSYGAEKRGGTCQCYISISDEKIGALFISRPNAAIAMNPASLDRLEPVMQPGSLMVVNQSLVPSRVKRQDIHPLYVPANELATKMGDDSIGNLVTLGALLAALPVVSISNVITVLKHMLAKNQKHLEMNRQAFIEGCIRGNGHLPAQYYISATA